LDNKYGLTDFFSLKNKEGAYIRDGAFKRNFTVADYLIIS
jgi:hypothetical protein